MLNRKAKNILDYINELKCCINYVYNVCVCERQRDRDSCVSDSSEVCLAVCGVCVHVKSSVPCERSDSAQRWRDKGCERERAVCRQASVHIHVCVRTIKEEEMISS